MPPHPKVITLTTWNANGLTAKTMELLHFLDQHHVSAALVTETHLTANRQYRAANYSTYRTDRPSGCPKGGTAVLVRRLVKHEQLTLPTLASVEATGVLLHTTNGPLRVIAAYCPPSTKLVLADIDALLDSPLPTILAGDLNAKHAAWNSRVQNKKGKDLLGHSIATGFTVIGPTEPTHYHHTGSGDVLDIALLSNIEQSVDIETLAALTSDHNPVLLTIGDDIVVEPPVRRPDYRRADWNKYRADLDEALDTSPITTPEQLDQATRQITEATQSAIETAIPTTEHKRCTIYDLPASLRSAVSSKNRTRRLWQQYRTADLKAEYNQQTRTLKLLLAEHRGQKWDEAVGELNEADGSTWRMTRKLLNKQPASPPIQGRTHLAVTPHDKATVLAEALEEQFTPNPPNRLSAGIERKVSAFLAAQALTESTIEPVTVSELSKIVGRLPNRKAPGADGIPNQAIKEMGEKAALRLVEIVNATLRMRHFPAQWKTARVILFPKPGKPLRDPGSYRPISLLSCLSKVCEKTILTRLQRQVDDMAIQIPQQFGFRAKHSTYHQLLRVTDTIRHGLDKQLLTGVVCLDIAKAFDRVWHVGLVDKLTKLGIDHSLITLVASYLRDRSFFVANQTTRSVDHPICAGVPQGSLLGPLLYSLYTNDIPTALPGSQLALYADDAAIVCQAKLGRTLQYDLQDSLDRLQRYFDRSRIQVNASKTTATMFTRRREFYQPAIAMGDEGISWTPSLKYLGLTLDAKLTFKEHLNLTRTRAIQKLGALRPLMCNKAMSVAAKVRLYTAIVRPTMTYGSPIWARCAHTHLQRLQTVQNMALRRALRLPMFARTADVHRQTGVPMLGEYLDALNEPFFAALTQHPNPLIHPLGLNYQPD